MCNTDRSQLPAPGHKIVIRDGKKLRQKRKKMQVLPPLEEKQRYFEKHVSFRARKRWYKKNRKKLWFKLKLNKKIRFLVRLRVPGKVLSTVRWVLVDFLRAKPRKFWGIYQFIGLPGEGKTLSMVAHIERAKKELAPMKLYIATNFFYKGQDMPILHWLDIIKAAKFAHNHGMHCLIAIDEIHTTFDASDWKSFPAEMLSLLSFNRKYGLQFLCSAQIYDRIPRKVRDIANYTVICKNTFGLDRHFANYYFSKSDYDDKFAGQRRRAEFIRTYVASDDLYNLYDTLQQVDTMTAQASEEQARKKEAFELLFGSQNETDEAEHGTD